MTRCLGNVQVFISPCIRRVQWSICEVDYYCGWVVHDIVIDLDILGVINNGGYTRR